MSINGRLSQIIIDLQDLARELGDCERAQHIRDIAYMLDSFLKRLRIS